METLRADYAPILTTDEFAAIRDQVPRPIVCTSGGFDPIHPGHATCIIESKLHVEAETGTRPATLVVVVNGDGFLRTKKGAAFQDLDTRARLVSCLRGVDYVVTYETDDDMTVSGALRAVRPDFFTKGGDRTSAANIAEWDLCQELGTQVIAGCGLDKHWSSSDMLARWKRLDAGS